MPFRHLLDIIYLKIEFKLKSSHQFYLHIFCEKDSGFKDKTSKMKEKNLFDIILFWNSFEPSPDKLCFLTV